MWMHNGSYLGSGLVGSVVPVLVEGRRIGRRYDRWRYIRAVDSHIMIVPWLHG